MKDWSGKKKLFLFGGLAAAVFAGIYAAVIAISMNTGPLAPEGGAQQPGTPPQAERGGVQRGRVAAPTRFNLLLCGVDETEYLTDVIMVASLSPDGREASILQLPRDSYIGTSVVATGKLNAVYGQNQRRIAALEEQVERLTGLSMDGYVTVTLGGLRDIVNDLGGIPMMLEQTIEYTPGQVLLAGPHLLTGQQAEWLVRYRAGYATGDIGRMAVQEQFLEAVIDAVREKGRVEALRAVARNYSSVSTDLPLSDMVEKAGDVVGLSAENIHFFIAPGSGETREGYSVYVLDEQALAGLIEEHFGS